MKRAPRRRSRAWIVLAALALAGAAGAWGAFFRVVPVRHAGAEAAYKYGTIGVEPAAGVPYWIWVVLPRVFPEHLPGPGGYTSLGVVWEEGEEVPVGFSKLTVGFPRVGPNCAACHAATWRASAEGKRAVVAGGPTSTFDPQAYLRFLAKCAEDPRFTADNLMPEIEYLTKLSAAERALYRSVLIPQTRAAVLAEAARYRWAERNPAWGPGRIDPFNPVKFGILRRPVDRTIGNSDMMPIWALDQRQGKPLHWDGLNSSVREVVLSSALGDGASRASLDPHAMAELEDWLRGLKAPRNPFPVDAAKAAAGAPVYAERCASCHGTPGAWTGRLVPVAAPDEAEGADRIGTDRHRVEMWDAAAAEAYNRYASGYDWKFRTFTNQESYVAPPLDALWIRGPFLHNGSVPTVWHLLRPDQRPERFYRGYDVVDPARVGFVWTVPEEDGRRHFVFDTRLPGNSNQGHAYGADLSEAQKDALLEYLKTL